MRIPAITRELGPGMAHTDNHRSYPGMAHTDNHRSYPGMAHTDNHRSYPGTHYEAREMVQRRNHYGDPEMLDLHDATIKSRTFPAASNDAGLEEFCDMSYACTRDVGTSRNGFRAHFKDPVH